MTTLMTWGNSDGIQGRCDAKCHNATAPTCTCMCGGRYHGKAQTGELDQAVREFSAEIEAEARRRAEQAGMKIQFSDALPLDQMPLFRTLIEQKHGGSDEKA